MNFILNAYTVIRYYRLAKTSQQSALQRYINLIKNLNLDKNNLIASSLESVIMADCYFCRFLAQHLKRIRYKIKLI